MPTLEERLEALERERRRIDEQIVALRQQIAEQNRRRVEQEQALEQSISKKFDGLMQVIVENGSAINQAITTRFDALNTRIDEQVATQTATVNTRFDEQTRAIRSQFEDTNMAVTALTVTVNAQGQNIRTIKNDISTMKEQVADLKQDNASFYSRFDRIDRSFDQQDQEIKALNRRSDQQSILLQQILDRLPPAP
jgi:chromosome segregation ATPase